MAPKNRENKSDATAYHCEKHQNYKLVILVNAIQNHLTL